MIVSVVRSDEIFSKWKVELVSDNLVKIFQDYAKNCDEKNSDLCEDVDKNVHTHGLEGSIIEWIPWRYPPKVSPPLSDQKG